MKNKKGFTLIELLAVITIIGIILLIAIPQIVTIIGITKDKNYSKIVGLVSSVGLAAIITTNLTIKLLSTNLKAVKEVVIPFMFIFLILISYLLFSLTRSNKKIEAAMDAIKEINSDN